MSSRIIHLPDLVIPSGLTDSNFLSSKRDFGDGDLLTIFAPAPLTGTVGILISWLEEPGQFDWKLFGTDNYTNADPGMKMSPNNSRTIEVAFRAIMLQSSLAELADRIFHVNKRIGSM